MGFWGNFFGGGDRALNALGEASEFAPFDPARLKAARLTLKMSQEATARILGVTHATYSRWENGHATPAKVYMEKVWKFINFADKIDSAAKED